MSEARQKALDEAFNDEGLRRMARRAGVSSVAALGKDKVTVNDELRAWAELMLTNILGKAIVLAIYYKTKTITEAILRQSFEQLNVKLDTYSDPGDEPFPPCESHREHLRKSQARAKRAGTLNAKAKPGKTAAKEIGHERRD